MFLLHQDNLDSVQISVRFCSEFSIDENVVIIPTMKTDINSKDITVLLVDDDIMVRFVYKTALYG